MINSSDKLVDLAQQRATQLFEEYQVGFTVHPYSGQHTQLTRKQARTWLNFLVWWDLHTAMRRIDRFFTKEHFDYFEQYYLNCIASQLAYSEGEHQNEADTDLRELDLELEKLEIDSSRQTLDAVWNGTENSRDSFLHTLLFGIISMEVADKGGDGNDEALKSATQLVSTRFSDLLLQIRGFLEESSEHLFEFSAVTDKSNKLKLSSFRLLLGTL